MVKYMLKANSQDPNSIGIDIGEMKVDRPLIAQPDATEQLFRVYASADWSTNAVSLAFYSINAQGKKTADHAACKVKITAHQTWLQEWQRSTYLIRSRIASLHKDVNDGEAHKMKRGLVYKLFSSLVDYDAAYRGMEEVVLDSNQLEATAQVKFQISDEGFVFNPCWVDSLGHIAGFIMNGNDNIYSKDQVFVNHGWDSMRCATTFSTDKMYQTYNRMQLASGTTYIGDTYILEDGNVVAIFEGVKVSSSSQFSSSV
jgi:naphtho-gamma-pyrone polyketide synthase